MPLRAALFEDRFFEVVVSGYLLWLLLFLHKNKKKLMISCLYTPFFRHK